MMVAPRLLAILAAASLTTLGCPLLAQTGTVTSSSASTTPDPRAQELVQAAVRTELAAAESDHTTWAFRDRDKTAEKEAVYQVVQCPAGELRRMVDVSGHPVPPDEQQKEAARISSFVHDSEAQAKQRKAGEHDDAQARTMLQMLPKAFIWKLQNETPELATLSFRPNPDFHAPSIESRVMATMAGEMVIAKADTRIRTLRGSLTDDVRIGGGVLGKLRKGGSFDVERREIAPHVWEITESHVHIDGRALLFKTIGQQEDEVKTNWRPSTATTLQAAAEQLDVHVN